MAFDLVLFGGTGDLAWRKLLPALFQAHRHGMLPGGGRILAIGRSAYSDDDYRNWLRERFHDVEDAKRPADGEFARFAALVHYLRVDLSQPADYARLREWVRMDAEAIVFYLATSPHLFPVVAEQLGRAGSTAATYASCSRSRSATTWPARRRSTAWCAPRSASRRRCASTTTSASRRCRT
jgi:glucose-6-phosphate 1-dehydrogenase